jgi:hypothetical protein
MIWLYVFLQDFLIPFLCDPDLQCTHGIIPSTTIPFYLLQEEMYGDTIIPP